ncbi:putative ferric aerobactin receptor [hydrothermal vent metagenome]|uniref:Putative ferric aerobactin receptor n=1 Tax=hydrothermal vent metagenome TaxID=652676 RepID=A0A3B0U8W1_9ZZZZ
MDSLLLNGYISFVPMNKNRLLFFLILLIGISLDCLGQGNNITLKGKITDTNGDPLELANISLKDFPIGTTSLRDGTYLLRIPAKREVVVVVSSVGYKTQQRTFTGKTGKTIFWDITLETSDKELAEIQVTRNRKNGGNVVKIDPRLVESLPDAATGGVEALIKTLPGVSSNNELSSQYTVRGGNFDENLVYVNGIEIYRPFLIRAGQQEGLSFINSDMVSSIEFSAGGFDAKYGDKMSSVLDIKYRKPTGFKGSSSVSLLGATAHIEDKTLNGKLSHISGIRYKSNRYMLSGLDEQGEYDPRFIDFQTYLTYELSKKLSISFLGNIAQNKYHFIPQSRKTTFGTWNTPLNTVIYFEGQEIDNFATYLGAFSADLHPNNNLNLKFIVSGYYAGEEETYDIRGDYYLNELERNMSSEAFGDSVLNLGVGTFINHARNYLEAQVYSFSHRGAYSSENHLLNWGFKINREVIQDKINEWVYRDSTGYSLPYSDTEVNLYWTLNSSANLRSFRFTSYFQDTYNIPVGSGDLYFTGGIRAQYWDFNNELIISPRTSLNYYPDWKNNIAFRLSAGMYHQPPFYKELKDREGNINYGQKAQRSYQVVLGTDYIFTAWGRPFRLTSEGYYKYMNRLIPYQIDNVRIRYLGNQEATGYATGLDTKVNGEFVSGLQSWVSLSFLRTRENIKNDGHGWIPRPTDQWVNFSMFFQDYVPGNPTYKMHLLAFYGARLPVGPPNSERWQDTFRMPPYRRIDLGFSKILISPNKTIQKPWLRYIKDMSVSLEVFNLLNINNTISYFWVTSNYGDQFAVPNYLTSRKINLKLSVKF